MMGIDAVPSTNLNTLPQRQMPKVTVIDARETKSILFLGIKGTALKNSSEAAQETVKHTVDTFV